MARALRLDPDERIVYRTATNIFVRMGMYLVAFMTAPIFGIGIPVLFGCWTGCYSDVVITSRRLLLWKTGLLRNRRGHRSIPFDQIYVTGIMTRTNIGQVPYTSSFAELDLQDGKTVKIQMPRVHVFFARLDDAIAAASSAAS